MKHHGSFLANLVLELHESRGQNVELTNKLVDISSLEVRCEVCNNNAYNNSKIDCGLGGNPIFSPSPQLIHCPYLLWLISLLNHMH